MDFSFNFTESPAPTITMSNAKILENERLTKIEQEKQLTVLIADEERKVVEKIIKEKARRLSQSESANAIEVMNLQNVVAATKIVSPAVVTITTKPSNVINNTGYVFTQADIGKHVEVKGRGKLKSYIY